MMGTCISSVVTNSNLEYVKGYTMPAFRALDTWTERLARVRLPGRSTGQDAGRAATGSCTS